MKPTNLQDLVLLDQLEIWSVPQLAARFGKTQRWAEVQMNKSGYVKMGCKTIERSKFMEYYRNQYRMSTEERKDTAVRANLSRKTA